MTSSAGTIRRVQSRIQTCSSYVEPPGSVGRTRSASVPPPPDGSEPDARLDADDSEAREDSQ